MAIGDFLEDLRGRFDGALRTASWYEGERLGLLYVRDDLDSRVASDHVGERLTWDGSRGVGDANATVRVRDRDVTVDFPVGPRRGLLLTLDPGAVSALPELIEEGTSRIGDEGLTFRGGADDGLSKRCPHCGSRNFEVRSARPGRPREGEANYRCRYCDREFDAPVLAESRLAVQEDE